MPVIIRSCSRPMILVLLRLPGLVFELHLFFSLGLRAQGEASSDFSFLPAYLKARDHYSRSELPLHDSFGFYNTLSCARL